MSAPIDDGGPAFPCDSIKQFPTQEGMSLRDWFAGQALVGLLSSPSLVAQPESIDTYLARWSYKYADEMLEARKAKTP